MIRLVLMDVDGTLVGASGPHATTWPALDEARARGVRLGLCTGRFGRGLAEEYAARVDADGLHVFQNGAVISRPGEPATHKTPLEPSLRWRNIFPLEREEMISPHESFLAL